MQKFQEVQQISPAPVWSPWTWNVPDALGAHLPSGARMRLVARVHPGMDGPLVSDLLRYVLSREQFACPSVLSCEELQARCPAGFGYASLLERYGVSIEVLPAR